MKHQQVFDRYLNNVVDYVQKRDRPDEQFMRSIEANLNISNADDYQRSLYALIDKILRRDPKTPIKWNYLPELANAIEMFGEEKE